MKRGIKAIIFDMNGVLELADYSSHPKRGHRLIGLNEYIARKLKISLDHWFDAIDSSYADSIEGKIPEKKALAVISRNLETSPKKLSKLLSKAYRKNFKRNKKLYKKIFSLKKKGYKIAILSDQWPPSKRALMPKKYVKHFDAVVVSCDVGVRKPDLKIYKITLKKLHLPAKNVLFIDNREWNLAPAKKLGMKTILFKDNEQLFKALEKMGVK